MGLFQMEIGTGVDAMSNVLDGEWIETDDWVRKVVRIGLVGNGAVTDVYDLYYGEQLIASVLLGRDAGDEVEENDMMTISSKKVCRPNEQLRLICHTAPATAAVHCVLDVKDIRRPRRRWRR